VAWERYVESAAARMTARPCPSDRFLWTNALHLKNLQGEIVVAPVTARRALPNGLIRHWVGGAFIPALSVDDVLPILNEYDHYADLFHAVGCGGEAGQAQRNRYWFSMRWFKRVYTVTTTLEIRTARWRRVSGTGIHFVEPDIPPSSVGWRSPSSTDWLGARW
jgi:hypothetical protein